jgi:ribonuclease R
MPSKAQKKIEQEIVSILAKDKNGLSAKQLSAELFIRKKNYHLFQKALNSLIYTHQIFKIKGSKKYRVGTQSRVIQGELRMTKGGFGFVHDEQNDVDVFVGRDHLNTALDLDIVEVKLYAKSRGKSEDGYVTKILERKRKFFVGTFHQTTYYGFVVPDDPKIYRDFFVPKEKQNDAEDGQKVVVNLEKWDSDHLNPEGFITEIIGWPGDAGVDVASVAHSFQLMTSFPENVDTAAQKISSGGLEKEIKGRLDLRNQVCFTIDPEDAKDFDDAVSLEKHPDGTLELGVHIADVSYYVLPDSDIDKEAFKRATSVYLVDRVLPMLPEHLSNELCSLQPQRDRLTMSCFMKLDSNFEVSSYRILPSVINSKNRFTYEEVQDIVNGEKNHSFSDILNSMWRLSKQLTEKRLEEGGIDFETPEVSFDLDQKGFPVAINRKERLDSHRMIEEFMLLANKTVARHVKKISSENQLLPFIYRIHAKPDPEKMLKFFDFLHAFGYKIKPVQKVSAKYFQQIIEKIKGTPEEIIIEEVALRSMMKAVYSTDNVGHFGLGFEDYTHFTSPIRRYPDLVVHRLLKAYASHNATYGIKELKKICEQASRMERTALEAERESVRMKQNEYISQHIDEEFDGIISGVTSFGIYVELPETLVEGLVHIRNLEGYYIYEEKTYTLMNTKTGRKLRLGDPVRIKVTKVNLEAGKVDFKLVD